MSEAKDAILSRVREALQDRPVPEPVARGYRRESLRDSDAVVEQLVDRLEDSVESGVGAVDGLGHLRGSVRFEAEKTLARPAGTWRGEDVDGYEIHHGVVTVDGSAEPFLDGARAGPVWGTTWHGALGDDDFRRAFLAEVAAVAGRRFVPAPGTAFAAVREARLDALGDLVAEHADTDALWRLVESGPPAGLPLLPPGASAPR